VLPFIDESEKKPSDGSAVGKLTLGMKGLAKSLEKTAARLGTMPTKCAPDPSPNPNPNPLHRCRRSSSAQSAW